MSESILVRVHRDVLADFGTRTETGDRIGVDLGAPVGAGSDFALEPVYVPTFRVTDDFSRRTDDASIECWYAAFDEINGSVALDLEAKHRLYSTFNRAYVRALHEAHG